MLQISMKPNNYLKKYNISLKQQECEFKTTFAHKKIMCNVEYIVEKQKVELYLF